jgi:hypothetical protein
VAESECLEAALEYASQGLLVVPVRCGDKKPWLTKWEDNASCDPAMIESWWGSEPASNVGVRLGEKSNLIDIECDDAEAEKKFAQLFDGVEIVTATYAGKRGKHRLFRWRSDLPFSHKAWFKIGKLEFRTGNAAGAQSVFPPSIHPDGGQYKWLVTIEDGGIAELPDHVIARLWNWVDGDPEADVGGNGKPKKSADEWAKITAGGKREGDGRNEDAAAYIGGLLRLMTSLDDTAQMSLIYNAAWAVNLKNAQPLEEDEFRKTFKSILHREQQRRVSESAELTMAKSPKQIVPGGNEKDGPKVPQGMKLVIVRDDPPMFELYAPQFSKARGGCIRLSAAQLCSFPALKIQALEQADYPLPASFRKAWEAKGGIYEQLVFSAEERQVSAVTKRMAVAAEYLLSRLLSATHAKDGKDEPDPKKPTRMSDGTIWFRWNEIWRDAIFDGLVQRDDSKRLSDALNMGPVCAKMWPSHGNGRRRYVVFNKELMSKLFKLAEAEES